MNYPAWLGKLGKKEEQKRAAEGLFPGRDGWYKTINYKKRYIAKPMPLDDVLERLSARVAEISGASQTKVVHKSVSSASIGELVETFIAHLWQRVETGQPRRMTRRTYDDYCDVLSRFVELVGTATPAAQAGPDWFSKYARSIAKRAATTRRRHIIYITAFFNWAGPGRHSQNFYKAAVNFGPDFTRPADSEVRGDLAKKHSIYTPAKFHAALAKVAHCPLLFAAGLIGLNLAYLPSDITSVPEAAIEGNVVTHPRGKTNILRKGWAWDETIAAVEAYKRTRTPAADAAGLLFLRDDGRPFNQRRNLGPDQAGSHGNTIGVYWQQITGDPFKDLRTTWSDAADGFTDDRAIDVTMGHGAKSVRHKHYVKTFDPARLAAVAQRVYDRFGVGLPPLAEPFLAASELVRRHGPERRRRPARRRRQTAKSGTAAT